MSKYLKKIGCVVAMLVISCGCALGQGNNGQKPVILLLHGVNSSSHKAWDTFVNHLDGKAEFCYCGNWEKSGSGFRLERVIQAGNIGSSTIHIQRSLALEAAVANSTVYGFYTMDFSSNNHLTFNQQGDEVGLVIGEILSLLGDDKEILIMGHSMGGLAARAYIKNNPDNPICGLITIGTPHGGSYMAYVKDWLADLEVSDLSTVRGVFESAKCAIEDGGLQCHVDPQSSEIENIARILVHILGLVFDIDLRSPAMDYLKPSSSEMKELQAQVFPTDLPVVLVVSNWNPDTHIGEFIDTYTQYCLDRFWQDYTNTNTDTAILDMFSHEIQQEFTDGIVSLPAQHLYLGVSNPSDTAPIVMNPLDVFHTDETKNVHDLENALLTLLGMLSGEGDVTMGFILDSSGSMSDNDPNDIRKTAMEMIVGQLAPLNDVFIIDFDSRATWLNQQSWHNWSRDDLIRSIRRIDSSGGTDVGAGIELLSNVWRQNASLVTKGGVLLLSDGIGDYDGQASWFMENGIPIYTISLVGEENAELLRQISSFTGGKYLKARTPEDIIARFQEFYFALERGNRVASFCESIEQDQTLQYTFEVDNSIRELFCNLNWPGSRIEMRVLDPAGNSHASDFVSNSFAHTSVPQPAAGSWLVELFGQEIPRNVEPFQLEVYAKSDAVFNLESDTLAAKPNSGVIALEVQKPFGFPVFTILREEAEVYTPSADTLDVSDRISDMAFSFRPDHGIGTYEVRYGFAAALPGDEIVQRELYYSTFVGEIRPGNIDQVSIVVSKLFLKAPLGSTRGNRPGLAFRAYKSIGQDPIARGYVTHVSPTECTLQIQEFLLPGEIEEGDYIELDPKFWKND